MKLDTMATKSKEVNPTIPVAMKIEGGKEVESDGYHVIAGSATKSFETYPNRIAALTDALGNKDSVKG